MFEKMMQQQAVSMKLENEKDEKKGAEIEEVPEGDVKIGKTVTLE